MILKQIQCLKIEIHLKVLHYSYIAVAFSPCPRSAETQRDES